MVYMKLVKGLFRFNESWTPFILSFFFLLFISVVAFMPKAHALTMPGSKVVISDSRTGVGSTYAYTFVAQTATPIKTITFEYCDTASSTCTPSTGGTTGVPVGISTTAMVQGSPTGIPSSTSIGATNGYIVLTVGTTAAQSVGSTVTVAYSAIINPSTPNTTSFVRITTKDGAGTAIDTATVAFAVLTSSSISVSASVDPSFTFSIAPVGGTVNGASINVSTGTTSASTIAFGTLANGVSKIAAHDTTVITNAANGYAITVAAAANPPLVSGSNDIDNFSGSNASPASWTSPSGTTKNVNTGFFGYTTEDVNLGTGTTNRFTSNLWSGFTTTPAEVAFSALGTTTRTIRVGWRAEINGLQPAGAYTGTVILVATPTY